MKAKIGNNKYSIGVINYDAEKNKADFVYQSELIKNGVSDEVINSIIEKPEGKRTIGELQLIVKRKEINDNYQAELDRLSEYKDYEPSSFDITTLTEYQGVRPYYEEVDNKIVQKWEVVDNDPSKILAKINELKQNLADTDYKVIKCYEASLAGEESPYDAKSLVSDRNAMRNEINNLQAIIDDTKIEGRSAKKS